MPGAGKVPIQRDMRRDDFPGSGFFGEPGKVVMVFGVVVVDCVPIVTF